MLFYSLRLPSAIWKYQISHFPAGIVCSWRSRAVWLVASPPQVESNSCTRPKQSLAISYNQQVLLEACYSIVSGVAHSSEHFEERVEVVAPTKSYIKTSRSAHPDLLNINSVFLTIWKLPTSHLETPLSWCLLAILHSRLPLPAWPMASWHRGPFSLLTVSVIEQAQKLRLTASSNIPDSWLPGKFVDVQHAGTTSFVTFDFSQCHPYQIDENLAQVVLFCKTATCYDNPFIISLFVELMGLVVRNPDCSGGAVPPVPVPLLKWTILPNVAHFVQLLGQGATCQRKGLL